MGSRALLRQAPWLLLILVGGLAIAQSSNTGRVFPYVGYLEENGFPVEGPRAMRINLFSSEGAGTACQTLDFVDVDVAQGRFTLELTDVFDSCLIAGELFADIAVGVDQASLVDLTTGEGSGRVRIGSVPFAAASPRAATLLVEKDLNVRGSGSVAGNLNVGGNAAVAGAVSATALDASGQIYWSAAGILRDDQGGSLELGSTGTPFIDFHNDTINDFDARIRLTGDDSLAVEGSGLDVEGYLTTGGDFRALNNSHESCSDVIVSQPERNFADDTAGSTYAGCGNGQYMIGIWTKHYQEGTNFRDRWVTYIRCCRL